MQFRRDHAIFIHEIRLKYVLRLFSFAPLATLAHGCQLHPRDGVHCARALGKNAQPRCPLVCVFCAPSSSFGTAIQSSPVFALSNTPSSPPSRSGRMLGIFTGGGILLLWHFKRHVWCPWAFPFLTLDS